MLRSTHNATSQCLMRSITRQAGRLILSSANRALMHVKRSRDEKLLIFIKQGSLYLQLKMSLFRSWNGQKWANQLGRLKMLLPSSRNSMHRSIALTSKSGSQNLDSLLSGRAPANPQASNRKDVRN